MIYHYRPFPLWSSASKSWEVPIFSLFSAFLGQKRGLCIAILDNKRRPMFEDWTRSPILQHWTVQSSYFQHWTFDITLLFAYTYESPMFVLLVQSCPSPKSNLVFPPLGGKQRLDGGGKLGNFQHFAVGFLDDIASRYQSFQRFRKCLFVDSRAETLFA